MEMIGTSILLGLVVWFVGWDNVKTFRNTSQIAVEYGNELYKQKLIEKLKK